MPLPVLPFLVFFLEFLVFFFVSPCEDLLVFLSVCPFFSSDFRGSVGMKNPCQHPSPNVKTFCKFEPQIWLEIITSRDAKSACFKGSRTSCREILFGIFWPNFGQKRSHHVMDASCREKSLLFWWCPCLFAKKKKTRSGRTGLIPRLEQFEK